MIRMGVDVYIEDDDTGTVTYNPRRAGKYLVTIDYGDIVIEMSKAEAVRLFRNLKVALETYA